MENAWQYEIWFGCVSSRKIIAAAAAAAVGVPVAPVLVTLAREVYELISVKAVNDKQTITDDFDAFQHSSLPRTCMNTRI